MKKHTMIVLLSFVLSFVAVADSPFMVKHSVQPPADALVADKASATEQQTTLAESLRNLQENADQPAPQADETEPCRESRSGQLLR